MALSLSSPAFKEGGSIPVKYTCKGKNVSPPLTWTNAPPQAQDFALVLEDPDAPSGTFTHWVIFNVPQTLAGLPEAEPAEGQLADGAVQGKNGFGRVGYGGPCPPPGRPHRYYFKLYALDQPLKLKAGASKEQVLSAMQGHVLAQTELLGMYGS